MRILRTMTAGNLGVIRGSVFVTLVLGLWAQQVAATMVTITTPTSIPANAVVVHFDGLLNSAFGGPSVVGPYTEAGVTLDQAVISAYPVPPSGSLAAAIYGGHLIFPTATNEVGWLDGASPAEKVTLFSDAAGQNLIGTFDITNPDFDFKRMYTAQPQGFRSDIPFRRMDLVPIGVFNTFFVDDLFFVVPEPGAGVFCAAGVLLLAYSRRQMNRRRVEEGN